MKLLKQTTLAAAIAAATALTAQAGMVALDDATMSDTTGQAGVTIETTTSSTGITIGSVIYTDTLATGETDGVGGVIGGGSVAITGNATHVNGITVQGWDLTNNVAASSTSRQTIDVNSNGDLITKTVQIDASGNVLTENGKRISVGQVALRNSANTANAILVSNLELTQASGNSEAHILNLQGANSTRATGMTAYAIGGQTADVSKADGNIAIVTAGESRIVNLDVDALDGAVQVRGLSYDDGSGGMMSSTQVIWAKGGNASAGGGVYIQGSDSVGTLKINSVGIGGASIGSVAINNLSQAGSVKRIYGH